MDLCRIIFGNQNCHNPTNDYLNISYNSQLNFDFVSVIDITGRKIIENKIDGVSSIQLNISHIPTGLYFLELKNENNSVYKKFIKESK